MSLPPKSTLKLDGHIRNLGITSTHRHDVLIHGEGITHQPQVHDSGRDIHLDFGGKGTRGRDGRSSRGLSQRLVLASAVKWSLIFDGAGSHVRANLSGLKLARVELDGAFSDFSLDLPAPDGMVTVSVDGFVRRLRLRRPAGVPVRIYVDGAARRLDLGSAVLVEDHSIDARVGSNVENGPEDGIEDWAGYRVYVSGAISGLSVREA